MLLVLLGLATAAEPGSPAEVELRWKPAYQLAYVTTGEDGRSAPAFMLAGGDGTGALTRPSLARGELRAWVPAGDELGLYGRVEGGTWALRLEPGGAAHAGGDLLVEAGGGLEHAFADVASVRATLGLRLAGWALADFPTHGNLGMVFGLHPRWRGVDLDLEGTLAAIGTDAPAWGTQKDSSSLRAGVGVRVPVGERYVRVGAEVLHTKTEWFGGEVVAGEPALALEDLRVAGVVGFGL